jgi:hypothetical protein
MQPLTVPGILFAYHLVNHSTPAVPAPYHDIQNPSGIPSKRSNNIPQVMSVCDNCVRFSDQVIISRAEVFSVGGRGSALPDHRR